MPLSVVQQQLVETSDCKDKQLIFSEIQRPQLASKYPSAWYVGPANWQEIAGQIMGSQEQICISQQALDYPYRHYEGQLPYPLSGREGRNGFLREELKNVEFTVTKDDLKHPELTIYSVSR